MNLDKYRRQIVQYSSVNIRRARVCLYTRSCSRALTESVLIFSYSCYFPDSTLATHSAWSQRCSNYRLTLSEWRHAVEFSVERLHLAVCEAWVTSSPLRPLTHTDSPKGHTANTSLFLCPSSHWTKPLNNHFYHPHHIQEVTLHHTFFCEEAVLHCLPVNSQFGNFHPAASFPLSHHS